MNGDVFLTGVGSISALGHDRVRVAESYTRASTRLVPRTFLGQQAAAGPLSPESESALAALLEAEPRYRDLDRSVQLALFASRQAVAHAGWSSSDPAFGVTLGSSRGATDLFERYHARFLESGARRTPSLTSPTTTLGNLSSWVAQDTQTRGPACEISSTCSTSLYALGSAVAWLRAGLAARFLAGGTEAPLTDFTIAQMKALRVYARDAGAPFPCRPCAADQGRQNTMVLGEGAAILALERLDPEALRRRAIPPLGRIAGLGFRVEPIQTNTSLSAEGDALYESMVQALGDLAPENVDVVVTHTPGTAQGDQGELAALRRVFGATLPTLTSNKWICGHTLGASGALSVEYATWILQTGRHAPYPYPVAFESRALRLPVRRVLINSVGFGGNGASVLLEAVPPPK